MTEKILLVEDEVPLARTVAEVLREAGYAVFLAHTAEDGLREAFAHQPDLALLDVMVPNMGGWELCKHLRAMSDLPIIFLTALGDVDNMVQGLEMGADDYLVKPFESRVLLARVKAHLRRSYRIQPEETITEYSFSNGELTIDVPARLVTVYGKDVALTPREFDLLETLAKNAGKVIHTKELVFRAWGMTDSDATANIKPYIHYLRKKLEADPASPRWIITARGVGYRLADD